MADFITTRSGANVPLILLRVFDAEGFFARLWRDNEAMLHRHGRTTTPQLALTPSLLWIVTRRPSSEYIGYKIWSISGYTGREDAGHFDEFTYEERPPGISDVGQFHTRSEGSATQANWCLMLLDELETLAVFH